MFTVELLKFIVDNKSVLIIQQEDSDVLELIRYGNYFTTPLAFFMSSDRVNSPLKLTACLTSHNGNKSCYSC